MPSTTSLSESAFDTMPWSGRLMLTALPRRDERALADSLGCESMSRSEIWEAFLILAMGPPAKCGGSVSVMSSRRESSKRSLTLSVMLSRPSLFLQAHASACQHAGADRLASRRGKARGARAHHACAHLAEGFRSTLLLGLNAQLVRVTRSGTVHGRRKQPARVSRSSPGGVPARRSVGAGSSRPGGRGRAAAAALRLRPGLAGVNY